MFEPEPSFFHDLVASSASGRGLSDISRVYLAGLLQEMVDRAPDLDRPVCLRVLGPIRADRALVLKEAGDASLFLSGFFPERGRRLGLAPSYYAALGRSAYGELSVRWFRRSPLGPVYGELARSFPLLQVTLREARESCASGPHGTASWVEEWLLGPRG